MGREAVSHFNTSALDPLNYFAANITISDPRATQPEESEPAFTEESSYQTAGKQIGVQNATWSTLWKPLSIRHPSLTGGLERGEHKSVRGRQ